MPGLAVRPTPDRLREALFNVLAPQIEGSVFLDAYAGSAAVGIEALSRGAKHVILIERNRQALAVIQENLRSLGIEAETTVIRGNVGRVLQGCTPDMAFIDPPYEDVNAYSRTLLILSETTCRLAIAQHASRVTLENCYGALEKTRVLRQGDNSLSFYQRAEDRSAGE